MTTQKPMDKKVYREFWVYPFKAANMLFVYKEPQKIKHEAPENFEEFHVIEYSAYEAEKLKSQKLIDRISEILDISRRVGCSLDEHCVACELTKVARQALEEYDQNKGE